MAKTFLAVIAAVVAVMAALILVPGLNNQSVSNQTQLSLEYSRQHLVKTDTGFAIASAESLAIGNDGSATYTKTGEQPKKFTVSSEEMKRLKDLVLESGFMQIPKTDYPAQEGLANFTKYTVKVSAGDKTKTISWANLEAYGSGGIPPSIITNTGERLDDIISSHA
jgi:hypothetical protein